MTEIEENIFENCEVIRNMFENVENFTITEFEEAFPSIKRFDLLYKLYDGNYDFTDDELIILLKDLNFFHCNQIIDILIIMKHRNNTFFLKYIDRNLYSNYNKIEKMKNIFRTAVLYEILPLIKYEHYSEEDLLYARKTTLKNDNTEIFDHLFSDINNISRVESEIIASNNSINILNYLIDNNIKINDYIVICACEHNNYKMLKLLLETCKYRMSILTECLSISVLNTNLKNVEYLVKNNVEVSEDTLLKALNLNNTEIIRSLLSYDAKLLYSNSLYQIPIQKCNYEVVKLLLDANSGKKDDMFAYACGNGDIKIVKLIIEYKPDIFYMGNFALNMAYMSDNLEIINYIKDLY